jgi:hypothetical protein
MVYLRKKNRKEVCQWKKRELARNNKRREVGGGGGLVLFGGCFRRVLAAGEPGSSYPKLVGRLGRSVPPPTTLMALPPNIAILSF